MKPLWLCAVCGEGIHAYTKYVVLLMSWQTDKREHCCGNCWDEIMESAQLGLELKSLGAVAVQMCLT